MHTLGLKLGIYTGAYLAVFYIIPVEFKQNSLTYILIAS